MQVRRSRGGTARSLDKVPAMSQRPCALRSDRPKPPRIKQLRCRRTDARKSAPRPSLMKWFKLLSQGGAVELRAAQPMLMQFARLKSSQPIEGFGT
jgi:hypothetical protein